MSNVVTWIVQAVDQFSATYQKMNDAITQSENKITSLNAKVQKIGEVSKSLALKITAPLAGIATLGINEFLNEKKAFDQMQETLDRLGSSAPFTFKEITDAANAIELKSFFQADDVISKVTNKLITLGTIAPENLLKAQNVIVDFSAKSGMSLENATSIFSRALQNPTNGTRFFEQQLGKIDPKIKEFIKQLVDSGNTAKAQAILIEIAARKTAGAAELAMKNAPFRVLQESINRIITEVGRELEPSFQKFVKTIHNLSYAVANLSPWVKDFIVTGGIIAALLPVIGIAVWGLVTAIKAIGLAFLVVTSPVGLLVAGLTALAVGLVVAYNKSEPFQRFINNAATGLVNLIKLLKEAALEIANLFSVKGVTEFKGNFKSQIENISFLGLGKPILPADLSKKDTNATLTLNVNDPTQVIKSQELSSDNSSMKMDMGHTFGGSQYLKTGGAY